MIAIGIFTTWLTLTAAGFAGLSVLRRAGAREDLERNLTPSELQTSVFADVRIPIPKALLQ
jgi:hypothetical protein